MLPDGTKGAEGTKSSVQCTTVRYTTLQYSTVRYITLQCTRVQQCSAKAAISLPAADQLTGTADRGFGGSTEGRERRRYGGEGGGRAL